VFTYSTADTYVSPITRRRPSRSWSNPLGSRAALSFSDLQSIRASRSEDTAVTIDFGSTRILATGRLIADTPARQLLRLVFCEELTEPEREMVLRHLSRLGETSTFEEDLSDPVVRAWQHHVEATGGQGQ
jgi:hypothetical protein